MTTTERDGRSCDLRVVLLCKGNGADASSYRPNRDESQWWGRRDALVRCVASFLFGPCHPGGGSKELVLLFDDDHAKMTMKLATDKTCSSSVVPTEQTILKLWKEAAQHLNSEIQANGMICRIDLDPTLANSNPSNGDKGTSTLPTGLDSKRQLLEYLQKHCPMEFLRTKGLNSKAEIILRKTNRKALVAVFHDWKKSLAKQQPSGKQDDDDDRIIEAIYSDLLKRNPVNGNGDRSNQAPPQVVAGTLHEMFQEFPCFGLTTTTQQHMSSTNTTNYHLCLFLGAVRDMTSNENSILQRACQKANVALVGIRFGTVPEFTSKILSVLAFHHCQHDNVIGTAIGRLLQSKTGQSLGTELTWKPEMHNLIVVGAVPLVSTRISTDLKNRCRVHWALVRIIVCTLWRSRLVSSKSTTVTHSNALYLIFDDGVTIHLKEDEFVANLASKHQAAPCEYQILTALIEKIKEASPPVTEWSKKKVASQVLKDVMKKSCQPETFIIAIDPQASNDNCIVSNQFYSRQESERTQSRSVVALLDICNNRSEAKPRKIYRALVHNCEKLKASVVHQSLVPNDCQDYEAATIVALQHFCYQNRLFIEESSKQGSKRKRRIEQQS